MKATVVLGNYYYKYYYNNISIITTTLSFLLYEGYYHQHTNKIAVRNIYVYTYHVYAHTYIYIYTIIYIHYLFLSLPIIFGVVSSIPQSLYAQGPVHLWFIILVKDVISISMGIYHTNYYLLVILTIYYLNITSILTFNLLKLL